MLAHVYQRVDYLILAYLADRHASGEYKSAAVSAGNAEVSVFSLTGTVYGAAHDSDLEPAGGLYADYPPLEFIGE